MRLLVGLGNPGPRHAYNRHNIGFLALDDIVERQGLSGWRKRFQGEVAEGTIAGERVIALKPLTFMNESGRAVGEALRFHKLEPADVVVLYDEIELAPGKIRAKQGGGAAGHNGIRSIDEHIGPDFWRVRLGIGHPGLKHLVHPHVLSDFTREEEAWLDPLLEAVAKEAPLLVKGDMAAFMSRVALALQPPKPKKERPPEGRSPGTEKDQD
jgi:PTH1 family peptidyl-tRNA hydrolase